MSIEDLRPECIVRMTRLEEQQKRLAEKIEERGKAQKEETDAVIETLSKVNEEIVQMRIEQARTNQIVCQHVEQCAKYQKEHGKKHDEEKASANRAAYLAGGTSGATSSLGILVAVLHKLGLL